jgi:bacterial/archaeal transporter family protein
MQNDLFIAILAGVGGMLGWGLADFFAKKTIDQIGDIVSLAWGHIFGTGVLFFIIMYRLVAYGERVSVPDGFEAWSLLALFGIAQAIVYLFVYKGFSKGQLAILNPIFASFSGITAILSIVIFGEVVTGHVIWGLVTLFLGILFISSDLEALKIKRFSFTHIPGFKEIAFATLLAAFWTLFWDKFIGGMNWLSYALFMYLFMTLTILVIARLRRINLWVVQRSTWKFLFLIGMSETIAYLAISLGYSSTSLTSIIALLSGSFSLPTIILAYLFLKEKITTLQTIGSLVVIVGIIILSL